MNRYKLVLLHTCDKFQGSNINFLSFGGSECVIRHHNNQRDLISINERFVRSCREFFRFSGYGNNYYVLSQEMVFVYQLPEMDHAMLCLVSHDSTYIHMYVHTYVLVFLFDRIDQFRKSADTEEGVPRDILYSKNNFVEIGCLYVINQGSGLHNSHVMVM